MNQHQDMKYWTFFGNPFYWEIDLFLKDAKVGVKDEYFINKNHEKLIKPGDWGVIRVEYDKRSKKQLGDRERMGRGVYAID